MADASYSPDLARRNALRSIKGTPGVSPPTANDIAVLERHGLIELAHPEFIRGVDRFSLTAAGEKMVATIGERG
jgi:hypothetical protein